VQVVGFFHLAARLWYARGGFSGSLLQLFVITRLLNYLLKGE